jgi:hypothetical protein
MSEERITPGEVTVFILPRVKRGFDDALKKLLRKETGEDTQPVRLGNDLSEWVALHAVGRRRARGRRTPAEKALSRAFQALAAARYHLRNDAEAEKELRDLRDRVEALWMRAGEDE